MKRWLIGLAVLVVLAGGTHVEAALQLDVGPHVRTFSDATRTRGYWFTAPGAFTITGLRVPLEVSGPQNMEVLRLNNPPPAYPTGTNDFVSLGYWSGVDSTAFVSTSIAVNSGDIIGILGARGTSVMNNSYGQTYFYDTSIFGQPVTIRRFGFQDNLYNGQAHDVWTENTVAIARVEMEYAAIPEPATFIIWSLLGALGITVGWRRRRRGVA